MANQEREAKKAKAKELGIEFPDNIPNDKLDELIKAKETELANVSDDEILDQTQAPEKSEEDILRQRAIMMDITIPSDADLDKIRELVNGKLKKGEPKKAKVEQDETNKALSEQRKKLMKLVRCIITCNDPGMKSWETTPIMSISNGILTLPKFVAPLNTEYHVPQAYFNLMKEQTCGIAVPGRDAKNRKITTRKTIKKYNLLVLDDLTPDEIADLKQAQIARDGL